MKLKFTILLAILVSFALTEGTCEGCSVCRTDGTDTWCEACYQSEMTYTSATKRTCSGTGIVGCLSQAAWEGGQYCIKCASGYAKVALDPASTTTAATKNGGCVKYTDTNAIKGTYSDTTTPLSMAYCKKDFKPDGAGACTAILATDKQPAVENCLGYDVPTSTPNFFSKCRRCEPGFDLFSYSYNYDTAATAPDSQYLQICVEKGDNVKGCDGVSELEQCKYCDIENGYYPKEVILNNLPHLAQSMVCTNGEDETALGMY